MPRPRLFLVLAALAIASCSDGGNAPKRGTPGLSVQLQGAAADTVRSPAVPIIATLNDSAGRPLSAASVTFRVATSAQGRYFGVSPTGMGAFGLQTTTASTDRAGHARADLMHAVVAGTGQLIVEAQTNAGLVADTIAVQTTPGHPFGIAVSPGDTTLYQGGSASISAIVVDQFHNARPERAALSVPTGGLALNGTTVTATAGPSRQVVRADYAGLRDSMFISVVPHGVIAGRGPGTFTFTTVELDGSGRTPVTVQNQSPFTVPEASTEWTADGSGFLYYVFDNSGHDVVYRTTLDGAATRVSTTSPMGSDNWPQTSLDGSWIYFSSLGGSSESYVYRMHADGSAVERLSLAGSAGTSDIFPSPSPDNSAVVYATTRGGASVDNPRIEVLHLASGTVTSLGTGSMPRWSPDGQWIAFNRGGGVMIVHPDGTGERAVVGQGYVGELSWSPDSKWIVAQNIIYRFDLLEVATGLRLPLQFTGNLQAPDWRPF